MGSPQEASARGSQGAEVQGHTPVAIGMHLGTTWHRRVRSTSLGTVPRTDCTSWPPSLPLHPPMCSPSPSPWLPVLSGHGLLWPALAGLSPAPR